MNSSIVSYPSRGSFGSAAYRGNCSGHLIADMLRFVRPRVFVDPAKGGNTSGDVCRSLEAEGLHIEYHGFDLSEGFNLLKDSIAERIGGSRADYAFFHSPYHDMIRYSGEVWGSTPHPDDLSRCVSYEDFLSKIREALQNIYDCLTPRGAYSVLIGDLRRDGQYFAIQSDLLQLAPGALDGIIIKAQHNCFSDKIRYSGKFVRISHEYLLNFRKNARVAGFLDATLAASRKLEMLSRACWRATVSAALRDSGGQAKLSEIYDRIERSSLDKTVSRPNWQARVRATLQTHFRSIERGVWAIH